MSVFEKTVTCERHGTTWPTFVCGHAASGEGPGFHFEPSPDDPWPDAWCDACDRALEREGGWTDDSTQEARIKLLCGACWEECFSTLRADAKRAGDARSRFEEAVERMSERQQALIARTNMAGHARYHLDQPTATFELRNEREVAAWRARFLIAGTWLSEDQSWFWAWANDSIDRRCTAECVKVKRAGERLGIERLWRASLTLPLPDAERQWLMAADILKAQGVYACREPERTVYLILFDVVPVQ